MSIEINGHIDGGEDALGTVKGILEGISTNIAKDDIVRMFYSSMALEFGKSADRAARTMPEKYGHMYDWNMLGYKSGRLWRDVLGGAASKRFATFEFLPSTRPVPATTPENTGIRREDFPNLSDRKYVFVNKAMVFETGITTNITPKNHDKLFVPLKHKTRVGWQDTDYSGTLKPYDIKRGFVWASRARQNHEGTAGNFTTLFELFYGSQSERVFAEMVEPRITNTVKKVYASNMPNLGGSELITRGSRVKRFSMREVETKAGRVSDQLRAAIREEVNREEDGFDDE